MLALLFKALVALGTALLGACALRAGNRRSLAESHVASGPSRGLLFDSSERNFLPAVLGLQLVPAIGLFVALYVVGGQQVTSDVPEFYVPVGHAVLGGQVPYRDFPLSYAPLFPYIGAGLLSIWDSPKVFVLFDLLLNAAALVMWYRAALLVYERDAARTAAVLYAASGHALIQVLLGTNQIWMGAALAASTLLLVRNRAAASGLAQAAALCTVKILTLLFWPILWMMAPSRLRWAAAAGGVAALVYGGFIAGGADIWVPLRQEGNLISPGNIPYLLGPLLSPLGANGARVFDVIALLLLGGTVAWLFLRSLRQSNEQKARSLMPALALIGLVFMLASKKAFGSYVVFFLFPVLMVLALGMRRRLMQMLFFAAFNLLMATESSVWFYLGGNAKSLAEWFTQGGSTIAAFVPIDVALLACYAWLVVLSLRALYAAARPATTALCAVSASAIQPGETDARIDSQESTARSLV